MKPEDFGLDISVEIISPAEAQAYLDNNAKHRPIKEKKVLEYMGEMRDGHWRLNGKTICFDRNGRLLNGQHRLSAVVRSGVPLTTVVVRGLDPDLVPKKTDAPEVQPTNE
jgi:hypothetical protein